MKIRAWSAARQIDGLYFLADSGDAHTNHLTPQFGFGLYGIRVTLDHMLNSLPETSAELDCRPVQPADVPALAAIAQHAFITSRFYGDPHFSTADCDRLYETWLRKSCLENYADAVFVAVQGDQPVAFVTCELDRAAGTGTLPLVGVAESLRGRGIGQGLVAHVLHWFAQQGVRRVSIVADGSNIPAQRLYQKCGFRTRQVQLWYHRWFMDQEHGA